jgi:hypothetical protein
MGGEVILRMAAGQRKAVDALMKKVAPGGSLIGPDCAHQKGYFPDCWFQWRGRDFQVGYAHSYGNSDWALAVAIAICKRFKVVKAGWDSVGYCKDMAEFNRARPFGHEVQSNTRIMRDYLKIKPGFEFADGTKATQEQINFTVKLYKEEIALSRIQGKEYMKAAEKMFAKAEETS